MTKWDPRFIGLTYRLALLGKTEEQIAFALDIAWCTFKVWRKRYPDLNTALNTGRDIADGQVAASLLKRAVGFEAEEELVTVLKTGAVVRTNVTRKYPPDVTACIFWLKNRQRALWCEALATKKLGEDVNAEALAAEVRAAAKAMREVDGIAETTQ